MFTLNLEYCCSTTKGSVLCDAKLKALSELVSFFKSSLSAIACFDWLNESLGGCEFRRYVSATAGA